MAFARSATHSIHEMASGLLHRHRSSREERGLASAQTHDQDRAFVAQYDEQQRPLATDEGQQHPRNNSLGRSSRGLSVYDFELIRTLGTGTFARVWLVRLANPSPEEDHDKVYALKVLRKVEGWSRPHINRGFVNRKQLSSSSKLTMSITSVQSLQMLLVIPSLLH
ncbi:serine/threonine-protein kinase PRKX [Diplocarpon mali]|nr:serine/threonine-protein kinase PRKX [Diplocarpon mali]